MSRDCNSWFSYERFQGLNAHRCETVFHRVDRWPPEMWALAIAGEAGELCNLLKKVVRGDYPGQDLYTETELRRQVLGELADIITYCDLAMSHLGADTGVEVLRKFNVVSARRGYPQVDSWSDFLRQIEE